MIARLIAYLNSHKVLLVFSCIFLGAYYHFFVQRTYVEIELSPSQKTYLKVYWAKSGELFSEKKRVRVTIDPSEKRYGFYIPNAASIDKLRIDPSQYTGEITIHSLLFTQRGYKPVEVKNESDFEEFLPAYDIDTLDFTNQGLHVKTSGDDSQFIFALPRTRVGGNIGRTVAEGVIIFCILFVFAGAMRGYRKEFSYLVPLYSIVCSLVLVMAVISIKDIHPDEYVHIDAATYYIDNWLPPVIDSPDIQHTYSVYGVSRLNSHEIYYFLAGKFQALLAPLHLPDYLAFRLFNVSLFFLLSLFVFHKKEFRPLALFLLVTPQIWYLFSYCNSDAFAIFISTLVAYQLVYEDSLYNSFVYKNGYNVSLLTPLILGILFALLLLSKKNYYFFILFAGGYTLLKIYDIPSFLRKDILLRIVAVALVGCAIFGLRKGLDYSVNGLDRKAKLMQVRSERAAPLYNPDTPLHEKHAYLYMKSRGVPFKQIITVDRWFEKTFRSSFGTYGYFTSSATPAYYNLVRFTALAMLLFLSVSVLLSRNRRYYILYSWTVFCGSLLICMSLYHSWTADFQNQGRYLLVIVLMFGVLFWHLRQNINMKIFNSLYACLFLIALYSFIAVGINNIPKAIPL